MLEGLRNQVQGRLAKWIQTTAKARAEEVLHQLVQEAVAVWETEGFSRWSDAEISCTARFFDCCDRVIYSHQADWPLVSVQYDGPQLTRGMRAGHEDPAQAPRPDMSVRFGDAEIKLEAKRLTVSDGLPAKYVREGMRRFVSGRYASTPPLPGGMLGYVYADAIPDVVAAVNLVVAGEPDFGPSHVLQLAGVTSHVATHSSLHQPNPDLLHFMVEVT